jgi:membrane protein implicated in regulation of membrane protease activity
VPEADGDKGKKLKRSILIEDVLILVSIGELFWLGVLKRTELWAQIAMGVVAVVMLVVLVRRLKRVHRAFKE